METPRRRTRHQDSGIAGLLGAWPGHHLIAANSPAHRKDDTMTALPLTLAISRYDHVEDLTSGRTKIQGVDLNYLDLPIHDIFHRFVNFRDFDIAEMSMAKFVSMVSQDDDTVTALPVFLSRVARHSSIYVRRDGPVKKPSDLKGRRVGVPEWAQTASVYSRGLIAHHYGVDLTSIDWVQAGQDQAGRREKVALKLPPGLKLTVVSDKALPNMLVDGELDAILVAQPPQLFKKGHPNIVRLFDDYFDQEQRYVRETKLLPIMHTVAVRKQVIDQHPWVAGNLMRAFEEIWGGELWPYGVEANRATLDVFLQYAFEQGVCHRRLQVEDLFPKQLHSEYRV
jgi:4,5-dihydroxyphthalate decarboxylase